MQILDRLFAPVTHTIKGNRLQDEEKTYFLCPSCNTFSYGHYGTLCDECQHQLQPTYCFGYENRLHIENPEVLYILRYLFPLYLYGSSSDIRSLIFRLKYHGELSLGYAFGHLLGRELWAAGYADCFDGIVPVPLHWLKYLKRGYNQSAIFAHGLSEVLGIPVVNLLRRTEYRKSQTKVALHEARSQNVEGVFSLRSAEVSRYTGQHLLLVDDVLTTGATASECIECLLGIPDVVLSFASIAVRPTLLGEAYSSIEE